jgi:hypothetical protein
MNNLIDEIYEEWIDEVMSIPLVQPGRRNADIERALLVNNQLVTNMYNIRRHLEMGTTLDNTMPNVIQDLFDAFFETETEPNYEHLEDVKVTLSEKDFEKFPSWTVDNTSNIGYKDCSICIEEFKQEDVVTKLPCKHIFHTTCIKHWLCSEKVTCPSCRKDTRE